MIETATWGRRILALVVDWLASYGVAELLVATGVLPGNPASIATMGVFVLESALLTAFVGGSFGKLATRLRVVQADGTPRPPDLVRAVARSVLICLVVPPLVFRRDGRGLHDMVAGTATVTLQDYLARSAG
ncbi:RDD family protein [Nocardioides aestuarii]|uniref:RDD family protein n=1 Tax=Nocardioides aestuarii TaxID=252231 RepID=A0ABW4TVH4_9ACTN